jgi:hypothetical protein
MNLVIRFFIALAVTCLAGCVGYGYPGGTYGGQPDYPGDYGYPGNSYPGDAYTRNIRCESESRRTRNCIVDTRGGVRISRRLSDAPCVQGRSWGYDSRSVWVSQGCRAEFIVGAGGGGYRPGQRPGGNGDYGQTVRCESQERHQRRCNVSVRRGVDIVRQLSRTRCVQGQNWGWDRGGIWVNGGCRAEFRIR